MLYSRAHLGRRNQLNAVASAVLKLDMLGLTLENGMIECPPPSDIHPFRWKAMLNHAIVNGIVTVGSDGWKV